jgi:hypothetical protein
VDDLKNMRKYQTGLLVAGAATVILGVWDVIKTGMVILLNPNMARSLAAFWGFEDADMSEELVALLMFLILADFVLRVFVALSAFQEGLGQNKGWLYVVIAVGLIVSLISGIDSGSAGKGHAIHRIFDTIAASTLLDLTSVAALLQVVVSSVMIKRIRKKQKNAT